MTNTEPDRSENYVPATEAAFHEAGHTAMSRACNAFVSEVSIWEAEKDGWVGESIADDPKSKEHMYAVRAAGLIALVLRRGSLEQRDLVGAGIGVSAKSRPYGDAARAGEAKYRDNGKAWKLAVDTLRENWGFVEALAEKLLNTPASNGKQSVIGGAVTSVCIAERHAPLEPKEALAKTEKAFKRESERTQPK